MYKNTTKSKYFAISSGFFFIFRMSDLNSSYNQIYCNIIDLRTCKFKASTAWLKKIMFYYPFLAENTWMVVKDSPPHPPRNKIRIHNEPRGIWKGNTCKLL